MIRIASFDIGKKNFAFTAYSIPIRTLTALPLIKRKDRYQTNGTVTAAFGSVIRRICETGELEHFEKVDLTANCDPKSYLDPETFHNMTDFLASFNSLWNTCQIFLVERQMSARKNYNTMALKLGQHCLAYFRIRYGRVKHTIEFPAYYKTQVLGAPKSGASKKAMSCSERKKWAVNEARRILHIRKDPSTLQTFESMRKKDDIADCMLQTIALLVLIQQDQYPLR